MSAHLDADFVISVEIQCIEVAALEYSSAGVLAYLIVGYRLRQLPLFEQCVAMQPACFGVNVNMRRSQDFGRFFAIFLESYFKFIKHEFKLPHEKFNSNRLGVWGFPH